MLLAHENSICSTAPLSNRMKPIARSSTSNVPPFTESPNDECSESETSLPSANLRNVWPDTATGRGLPMSHTARSIMWTPRSMSGPPPERAFVVNQPPLPGMPRRRCQPQRPA